MTRRNKAIDAVSPAAYVEIHPDDAVVLGIQEGETVSVSSRRGSINIQTRITERPLPGTVFIPFHFREAAANMLTNNVMDPIAKIPEFKVCAVRINRIEEKQDN
jgi:predicted molibdopterin-dependent oxidoreductase YjgC